MGHGLRPILAKLHHTPLVRVRPATSWTIKSLFLVNFEKGLASSIKQAFGRWLGANGPANVPANGHFQYVQQVGGVANESIDFPSSSNSKTSRRCPGRASVLSSAAQAE